MSKIDKVDERIQRWGEKVANSKGSRKSFYVQLDWFEDAEDIRTIAELKEESLFTQFMRISLRTVAPLLLFGDTDHMTVLGLGGEIEEHQNLSVSTETRLLNEMRSLGEAISYGLSAPIMENTQVGELDESTHEVVVDEMKGLEERLIAHMSNMFHQNAQAVSAISSLQSVSSPKPDFDGLGDDDYDYDLDDDDISLESLLVKEGAAQTDQSISRTMVKAALTLFSDD